MIRRLQKLEDRASMQRNEKGETPAEVLQRRIRIQCEAEGVPFKDLSAQTGESVATLISRKRYAVLHLRNRLSILKDELLNY